MCQKKLANLITFESYIMYRLSEFRIINRIREFKFSLHVNYGLFIGPGRAKIKLNKFQCRHTKAKFVPNPMNRFGYETYIRPQMNTKDCDIDGL
jgi:hypothetical protein